MEGNNKSHVQRGSTWNKLHLTNRYGWKRASMEVFPVDENLTGGPKPGQRMTYLHRQASVMTRLCILHLDYMSDRLKLTRKKYVRVIYRRPSLLFSGHHAFLLSHYREVRMRSGRTPCHWTIITVTWFRNLFLAGTLSRLWSPVDMCCGMRAYIIVLLWTSLSLGSTATIVIIIITIFITITNMTVITTLSQ